MGDIAKRALQLVEQGASYSEYPCNQLVHYALTGRKEGHLARDFLTRGKEATEPYQEGDVIVSKDGTHCGIFVDSTHFVHASSSKQKAVKLDSNQLDVVFKKNFHVRRLK
jgi:cell wall-associated NlpC family hydrolase